MLAWLIGFSIANSSPARSPSPSAAKASDRPDRGVGVLAAVLADARQVALDVARVDVAIWSNGGVNSRTSPSSRRTRCSSTAAIARAARVGSAAPESTLQDCAIESIRHSSFGGGAERRAVVEVRAAVPVAVPAVALERPPERLQRALASAQRA